ncbi:protocatechuate 3,4-dioxygenase alpha subunit [Nocardia amikacinitolerans]|uniref:Protocatechuate 3,4-dioxygenase alpha subunit n=1 Tax=Nocardia amikacinitolerans TaxID=756689 RepID=A0A285L295_9NOCA|nr:protocatechuate 3,4-dioxygenase subunit alpha [Nocardia amikacinitolerans]MCP2296650.1 protocatechuate 3,4-dioxygenase alpha subunit [Nocardia amikacinitolerans]SNY79015.1 protocatechuate 3,4-dioxygenase alpha subunit [Nocardia amikacinitolerans]
MTEHLLSTPSQTVGPYLHIGLTWPDGAFAAPVGTEDAVWIRGEVFDGAGEPITDALVETWQVDHTARAELDRARSARMGFGRSDTRDGEYAIHTVVPPRVPARGAAMQAPHLNVSVFARGLLHRVVTRIYFPEFGAANAADPVLNSIEPARRERLLARRVDDGYVFDIRLQGELETVFFDV